MDFCYPVLNSNFNEKKKTTKIIKWNPLLFYIVVCMCVSELILKYNLRLSFKHIV